MKFILSLVFLCLSFGILAQSDDWRLISNGNKIYEPGNCDQPYIVTAKDGTWVCTFTTSPGQEGDQIQYIVSSYSTDQGKTWSEPVEIEPAAANIEASWAMPLITSYDRVYVFYTCNGDAIRSLSDEKIMQLLFWKDTIKDPKSISEIGFSVLPRTFKKPYGSFELFPEILSDGFPEYYKNVALVAFPLVNDGIIEDINKIQQNYPLR
jgi:hypothetical protein